MSLKPYCKPNCHIERSRDAMNQKFSSFLFLFFCFTITSFLNAQTENDSLTKYSYEELDKIIKKVQSSNIQRRDLLVEEYLRRAKNDKDSLKIAEAYFLKAVYSNDSSALKYSDSIINITKYVKGHKKFPAMGYYFKGYCLYMFGKNQEALDNFLIALKYLKQTKNIRLELDVRNSIISLNSNWKDSEETLKYQIEIVYFLYSLRDKNVHYRNRYLKALDNLSSAYIGTKKYKKSLLNSKKGIEETINTQDTIKYYDFVTNSGIAFYHLQYYHKAIDSIKKGLPYADNSRKIIRNYIIAKSYNKLKQSEKAHFHFLKTDSIYQATKDIFPEMRDTYEHIIAYYKSKNDLENQIKYYDRLLEADKIIDSTYTYVTETVNKKFDTPQAIAERARLVAELKAKESTWKYSFGSIAAVLAVVLGILFTVYRRQKQYKRRFDKLMEDATKQKGIERISTPLNTKSSTSIQTNGSAEALKADSKDLKEKDIGISETIVNNILKGLTNFEKSEKYRKQVTLTSLAKDLATNPKYLSKVINWHYQKNFSSYISELRVNYAVKRLKEEATFRNYTIKAIAYEAGFGNAESFSKGFYKVTGIYPSYFIKQLQKRLEN